MERWDYQKQGRVGCNEVLLLPPSPEAQSTSAIAPLPGASCAQWHQVSLGTPWDLDLPAYIPLPISFYQKPNHRATHQAPQLENALGWGEKAVRSPA